MKIISSVGQVIVSLKGTELLREERRLLAHPKVGGVVLFRENWKLPKDAQITDAAIQEAIASLKKLTAEIHAINPLLIIMVDHEGGKIWRFEAGFKKVPSAKSFGADYETNSKNCLDSSFQWGFKMAEELLESGINLSLAPVVDLDRGNKVITGYGRAIHQNPKIVIEVARSFIQGMNKAGMPAVLKHFPGHGSCQEDSHECTPKDNRSLQDLEENDLLPFKLLLGMNELQIGAVMPAHIIYPSVDPNHTAGFSFIWIQKILRDRLGFKGIVMSDCLSMKGADIGASLDKLRAAQAAGCDFLMLTHQHDEALNRLFSVLNKIPDSQQSQNRRAWFQASLRSSFTGSKTLARNP